MTLAGVRLGFENPARARLAWAFALSVAIHLFCFGVLDIGDRLEWWKDSPLRRWVQRHFPTSVPPPLLLSPTNQLARSQEPPLLYVEVDPAAVSEPPPEAKYYSSVSSRAANPEPDRETNIPKIEGKQTQIVKTFDTLRPQAPAPAPTPPAPAPPKPAPPEKVAEAPPKPAAPEPKAEPVTAAAKPAASQPAGDLAVGKPKTEDKPAEGDDAASGKPVAAERPRTLAAMRVQKGILAGEKMKQDGGVKRRSLQTSLDVKGTPFGAYDEAIIAAIQRRWYDLLDERNIVPRSGKVVLDFQLKHDGRVTNMKVSETTVGDFLAILCQKAVEDPAPFAPWPSDMRRLNRTDYREVRFTFYYN